MLSNENRSRIEEMSKNIELTSGQLQNLTGELKPGEPQPPINRSNFYINRGTKESTYTIDRLLFEDYFKNLNEYRRGVREHGYRMDEITQQEKEQAKYPTPSTAQPASTMQEFNQWKKDELMADPKADVKYSTFMKFQAGLKPGKKGMFTDEELKKMGITQEEAILLQSL